MVASVSIFHCTDHALLSKRASTILYVGGQQHANVACSEDKTSSSGVSHHAICKDCQHGLKSTPSRGSHCKHQEQGRSFCAGSFSFQSGNEVNGSHAFTVAVADDNSTSGV